MKKLIAGAAVATALLAGANAATLRIPLPDIGTFTSYEDYNPSDTFTGTGFLGIYPTFSTDFGSAGPAFGHVFGLENYNGIFSETELQARLAGLSGATIHSASLNFSIANGSCGNESVLVTSFSTTGTLGYNACAPNNLGSVDPSGITSGANSINITTLVSAAVGADQSYLGLFLAPQGPGHNYLWTDTYAYGGTQADADLVICYTPGSTGPDASGKAALLSSVPDASSTAAPLGLCVSGLLGLKRKKQ